MKKQLIVGLILTILIGGIVFWFQKDHQDQLFTAMKVPEFELTNQENKIIYQKDLEGKVYLVEFFFANCPTICPVMNRNLIQISEEINSPDLAIISITIDPKRDTPENLKAHASYLGIQNPNWHFLTGDRDYIFELSKKFNLYVGEDESSAEGLNHSGKFALIDKNGNIRSRFDKNGMPILYYSGLNYTDAEGKKMDLKGKFHPQVEWLKEDILKLLNEN